MEPGRTLFYLGKRLKVAGLQGIAKDDNNSSFKPFAELSHQDSRHSLYPELPVHNLAAGLFSGDQEPLGFQCA